MALSSLLSALAMPNLEIVCGGLGSSTPRYLLLRILLWLTPLGGIIGSKTTLQDRAGRVPFWLLNILVTMNALHIYEAVTSSAGYHLLENSQFKFLNEFESRFWWWWGVLDAGPRTVAVFLTLSPESWTVVVVGYPLYVSGIFVYSWSISRKCKNRAVHALNGNEISLKSSKSWTRRRTKGLGLLGCNLIRRFIGTMVVLWMATILYGPWSVVWPSVRRNVDSSVISLVNPSSVVLLIWTIFAYKDLWQMFIQLGWMFIELGCCIYWWLRVTVKKTSHRSHCVTTSKKAVKWDDQLKKTWDWVDDRDMDQVLRKEEDTRRFRIARRIMSKRRGWMLKSRAFKLGRETLHSGSQRVRACSYLFSSRWQKHYSEGMRRKRAAQSAWRRLQLWMAGHPCLWKSLEKLNIKIPISDLISVLDSHPEWFTTDGICLEVIRTPLRRLGLYISHVPLSLLPQKVLEGSEEHGSKYLFWRMNNGVGHYAHSFKPGDLCFEITNYLLLPGNLSWVFGSAKENIGLESPVKDPSLRKLTTSRNSESWSPISPLDKTNRVEGRRRSERLHLKRPRERHENCVGHERQTCLLCDEELTKDDERSGSLQNLIFCRRCGRGFHLSCSGIKDGWADHWNLDCSHHGLDCCSATVQSKRGTVVKTTNKEVCDPSGSPKISQSILVGSPEKDEIAWEESDLSRLRKLRKRSRILTPLAGLSVRVMWKRVSLWIRKAQ